jgi:hypothetical protein
MKARSDLGRSSPTCPLTRSDWIPADRAEHRELGCNFGWLPVRIGVDNDYRAFGFVARRSGGGLLAGGPETLHADPLSRKAHVLEDVRGGVGEPAGAAHICRGLRDLGSARDS